MAAEILLVRHGQDKDSAGKILNGRRDPDLTLLGERQAAAVAKKIRTLVGGRIATLYSSPMRRAVGTAEPTQSELGLDGFMQFPALQERDLGVFTGLTVAQALKKVVDPRHLIVTPHTTYVEDEYYGCESFQRTQRRLRPFARYVHNTHGDGEAVVVVMHGDAMRGLAGVLLDKPMSEMLEEPIHNGDILHIADGVMQRIELEPIAA